MTIKQIKTLINLNPDSFQVIKTDSQYLIGKMDFELVEIDSVLGIYKRISKINFNQFMKLNLEKVKQISSGSSLYQCYLYKLIKE